MEPKTNKTALVLVIILLAIAAYIAYTKYQPISETAPLSTVSDTYIYSKYNFTIALPNGYIPHEEAAEGGPHTVITLPNGFMNYYPNADFWEQYDLPESTYVRDEKLGEVVFKVYNQFGREWYWYRHGAVGYAYSGNPVDLATFAHTAHE
jgi:hypothetical protein